MKPGASRVLLCSLSTDPYLRNSESSLTGGYFVRLRLFARGETEPDGIALGDLEPSRLMRAFRV